MEDAATSALLRSVDGGSRDTCSSGECRPPRNQKPHAEGQQRLTFRDLGFDDLFSSVEQEWHDQALCAQTDPEAFFPEKGGSTREAKRICQACGVRDECLEYALLHDERFGIWGGLSERERRRLKKRLGS